LSGRVPDQGLSAGVYLGQIRRGADGCSPRWDNPCDRERRAWRFPKTVRHRDSGINSPGDTNSSFSGSVSTYTALPTGPATGFTTRRIIFVVATNNLSGGASISSVLINGSISATLHVQRLFGDNGTPLSPQKTIGRAFDTGIVIRNPSHRRALLGRLKRKLHQPE
jgi:hypothetical protein